MADTPITWFDVTAIADELATFPTDGQDAILAWVNDMFDTALLRASQVKMGRVYLAAHAATMAKIKGGTSGPVTSEAVGGLSRSYAVLLVGGTLAGSHYADMLNLILATSNARLPRVI